MFVASRSHRFLLQVWSGTPTFFHCFTASNTSLSVCDLPTDEDKNKNCLDFGQQNWTVPELPAHTRTKWGTALIFSLWNGSDNFALNFLGLAKRWHGRWHGTTIISHSILTPVQCPEFKTPNSLVLRWKKRQVIYTYIYIYFSQKCSGGRGHLVQRRGSTGQFFFRCTFPPEYIYNKMLPLGIHLIVVTCIFFSKIMRKATIVHTTFRRQDNLSKIVQETSHFSAVVVCKLHVGTTCVAKTAGCRQHI